MGQIWDIKNKIKILTTIHVEAMEVSSPRVVEAESFEVPFIRLIRIVASRNVSAFKPDTHLFDINILVTIYLKYQYQYL